MTPSGAPAHAIARRPPDDEDGPLVELAAIDRFQLLDVYAQGAVVHEPGGGGRIDALATISAGDRAAGEGGRPGTPRVSRDGTIMLHDADSRAPGLKAALEASGKKRLTIAVGFDEPDLFLQQRFVLYTATALKVYGDQYRLMEIVPKGNNTFEHVIHEQGSERYAELLKDCKVSASLYFVLAEWDTDNHARVLMPDGLGFYRLRTTSRHSLRNILGTFQYLARFTGGRLAGVPLELQITYREVSDPGGVKRNIPTWSLAMKPPNGIVLDTRNFAPMVEQALKEGQALHVPGPGAKALAAPRRETWEDAAAEGPEPFEPDDADIARLMAGASPADETYWRMRWFGQVTGTRYANDAGRAEWMLEYTDQETNSLAAWLKGVTNAEAEQMLLALADRLATAEEQQRTADRARRYTQIFGEDDAHSSDGQAQTQASLTEVVDDEADPDIDPDAGECELCNCFTKLAMDDNGQLVCADQQACAGRIQDERRLGNWLDDIRERIAGSEDKSVADYQRRKNVGMLIQRATDNDASASRLLLQALVGSSSLAGLSNGVCAVIETEAREPSWAETVKRVMARLKETSG